MTTTDKPIRRKTKSTRKKPSHVPSPSNDARTARGNSYSEKQRSTFVELAAEIGISPTIRRLGYPTFPTATKWMAQYGVQPPKSPLTLAVGQMNHWYGLDEKRAVAQQILDHAFELLTMGTPAIDPTTNETTYTPLNARDLSAVSGAVTKAISTLQLVEGKATEIIESQAVAAPELLDILETYRAKNDAKVTHLRAVN